MVFNNLSGAVPISTNCEEDSSVALLNNVHDLILEYNSNANTQSNISEFQQNELHDDVVSDTQYTKSELNFFENESLSYISNLICAKIVKEMYCENCRNILQTNSELSENDTIEARDNLFIYPSAHFITEFKKIFEFAMQLIPIFCSESSLKKIVIGEVKKRYNDDVETKKIEEVSDIGCVKHNTEIIDKLYESTVAYALKIFCKNINDLLTGKIKDLPPEPSSIQELARVFWIKKSRIGKHSDIFKS